MRVAFAFGLLAGMLVGELMRDRAVVVVLPGAIAPRLERPPPRFDARSPIVLPDVLTAVSL
ncbi:MAG TPA: hypothetical protein VGF94_08085 [Kofleriaceae bacterium]|jgi:hypothetical protein